ncbi:MAG TPA: helix-turn-helix transcriptional regulator [Candidatus Faecousia intestinigallinarum]|nr:helix-turn-helix transcriptional regulator [Candidatus Faecousia intestinigallinarum]
MEVRENRVRELCAEYGIGATALSRRFNIPRRTVEDWFAGKSSPPDYFLAMMKKILENNL